MVFEIGRAGALGGDHAGADGGFRGAGFSEERAFQGCYHTAQYFSAAAPGLVLGRGDSQIENVLGGKAAIGGSQGQATFRDRTQSPPDGRTGFEYLIQ